MEEVIIRTLKEFGIEAYRVDGMTGVWTQNRKIAAMGMYVARYDTVFVQRIF